MVQRKKKIQCQLVSLSLKKIKSHKVYLLLSKIGKSYNFTTPNTSIFSQLEATVFHFLGIKRNISWASLSLIL